MQRPQAPDDFDQGRVIGFEEIAFPPQEATQARMRSAAMTANPARRSLGMIFQFHRGIEASEQQRRSEGALPTRDFS